MAYRAAALLALLTVGTRCLAAEIFSTFGPPPGFSATTYTPVNFYTQPQITGTHLAFAFTVPQASDFMLDAIDIAASWSGTKKNALFALYIDAAGVPANVPLVVLAENPVALQQDLPAVLNLPSPSPLILHAGATYWMTVAPANLDVSVPADDFVQLWLNPDRRIMQTSRVWFDDGPWGAWFEPPIEVEAIALRVSAHPVPLPGASTLLLAPLLIQRRIFVRRRARRSRSF